MSTAFIDPITCDFPMGSIPYATNKEAICQRLRTCLCLIRGESCFYPDAGLDITNQAFRNRANVQLIEGFYRPLILAIPGITRIVDFSIDFVGTEARYTISVECDDSETIETGGLIDGL